MMTNYMWLGGGLVLIFCSKWISPVLVYMFGPRYTSLNDDLRTAKMLARIGLLITAIVAFKWSMIASWILSCIILIDFLYRRFNHNLTINWN